LQLKHDPEKWVPVFRKDCSNKKIERDDDSKKSYRALSDRASVEARCITKRTPEGARQMRLVGEPAEMADAGQRHPVANQLLGGIDAPLRVIAMGRDSERSA
jgi:hypothetical protein